MTKRRSLDDTCDIFLSRRRVRSPPACQRSASDLPRCAPPSCAENIVVPPCFLLPRPLEIPKLSATAQIRASAKPLPLPGSSGITHPKPTRLANGREHVPRPRNPFILFRCDLVHQRRMMPRSDLDDTNISRIAGDLWREMSTEQKQPWIDLAAQEKAHHARLYPGYKYAPTHGGSKIKKTKNDTVDRAPRQGPRMCAASPVGQAKSRRQAERPRPYPQPLLRRRSSSCPPVGAVPVPSHSLDQWIPPLVTQDDMQRRPSQAVMYQLVAQQPAVEPTPVPSNCNPAVPLQGFDWLSAPQIDPSLLDPGYLLPDLNQYPESSVPNPSFFDNKPLFIMPGVSDPGLSLQDLTELEHLTVGTTFTDPFSALAATTTGHTGSLYPYPMAIPPFDCYGYSTDSPSTSSTGTFASY